jgi:hypothetical protein
MMRLRLLSIKVGAVFTTVYLKLMRRSRIETMRLRIQYPETTITITVKTVFYWSRITTWL